jgi:hypothetical protein
VNTSSKNVTCKSNFPSSFQNVFFNMPKKVLNNVTCCTYVFYCLSKIILSLSSLNMVSWSKISMCILCPQANWGEITYIFILLKKNLILSMCVQCRLTQHLRIDNIIRKANKQMNELFSAINNLFNNVMPIYLMVVVIFNKSFESLDMNTCEALMAP